MYTGVGRSGKSKNSPGPHPEAPQPPLQLKATTRGVAWVHAGPGCPATMYSTRNLGSAAIWVSLDRLRRSGRLRESDKVLVLGAEATKYLYGGFVYTH